YTALLRAPVATGFRTPVLAQGRHLPEVVYGMIKVQQCIHLLGCSASRLHQERHAFPYPQRPIGDKEDVVRLGDTESLPGKRSQGVLGGLTLSNPGEIRLLALE